jgi:hypothetical protein
MTTVADQFAEILAIAGVKRIYGRLSSRWLAAAIGFTPLA